jgi:hypothetical protein
LKARQVSTLEACKGEKLVSKFCFRVGLSLCRYAEAEAARIAREIENQVTTNIHVQEERGGAPVQVEFGVCARVCACVRACVRFVFRLCVFRSRGTRLP